MTSTPPRAKPAGNHGLLLAYAINCGVWYFLSMFGASGEGGIDGVRLLRWIGFGTIAAFAILSAGLAFSGRSNGALVSALLPIPAVFLILYVGLVGDAARTRSRPNDPEFIQACQGAGVSYIALPSAPVTSLAYDWAANSVRPEYTHFRIDKGGNVSELNFMLVERFPSAIKFTERPCHWCGVGGTPKGQFERNINQAAFSRGKPTDELSADAIVYYDSKRRRLKENGAAIEEVSITVSDRRDAKVLARLRYVLDSMGRRACGTTSGNVMDEEQFVLRSLGLPTKRNR